MIQMTNLKNLYKDIKNKQMTYCIFNFIHTIELN